MADNTPAGTPVVTAFVAYLTHEGEWFVVRDLQKTTLELDRSATADEIYAGSTVVLNGAFTGNPGEVKALTAFIISYSHEGTWAGISDPRVVSLAPDRIATEDDITGGCSVILKDLAGQQAAQYTQVIMMQTARALQEQQANQQLLSQIGQGAQQRPGSGLLVGGR